MSFANLFGLLGLLSLPVIVGLHLLRERQRRVVVSHLGLWAFLEREVQGPRALRIPLTWLLLLDLGIAALLSLAWAQPRLALRLPIPPARHLVILIDVSSSMRALDGTSNRFAQARVEALRLIDGRGAQDVVTLLTFGQRATLLADSRSAGFPALVERLNALAAGETSLADGDQAAALQAALASGRAALEQAAPGDEPARAPLRQPDFYILTDGSFALEQPPGLAQLGYPLHWRFLGRGVDNQAVIALNATPLGGGQYQIFARLANFGARPAARTASLEVDGQAAAQTPVNLPPGSSVTHVWRITAGANGAPAEVQVRLRGRDPLPEDDSASLGLQPAGRIRVALVADDPGAFQQAIQAIPGAELSLIAPDDYPAQAASQPPFELTIFRGYQPPAWPAGQVLLVDPPGAGQASGGLLGAAARQTIPAGAVTQAPSPSPVVAGIDFSGVRWGRAWSLAALPAGFAPLLQAAGAPLLLEGPAGGPGAGPVLVLLADLAQGNFTRHPAFPILMANLVELARQAPLPASFQTGQALPLPPAGAYQSIQITPPQRPAVALAAPWPPTWDDTLDPGLYRFRFTRSNGETAEFSAGAQAGSAVESDLRARAWPQALAEAGAAPGGAPGRPQARPLDLWPWLLGAALLLWLAEAALAWRR